MAKTWKSLSSDIFEGAPTNGKDTPNYLMVQVSESPQGKQSLRICQAWMPADSEELKPTKKGFNLVIDDIVEFKKCITAVVNNSK